MAPNPTSHPAGHLLLAFGNGQLDDATAEMLVAHFEVCPSCRAKAANLSGDNFLERLRAVQFRRATVLPAKPPAEEANFSTPTNMVPTTVPPELRDHQQYEVIRELGRGGMGVVYLAKNKMMGRAEVLKVVSKDLLNHPSAAPVSSARFVLPPGSTIRTLSRRFRRSRLVNWWCWRWSTWRARNWPGWSARTVRCRWRMPATTFNRRQWACSTLSRKA